MASQFITATGPPELLIEIFKSCETFHDAWALASTCNHTYDIWHGTDAGAGLVWHFLQREMPGSEEALISVRAANLVLDAELADCLPPKAMRLDLLGSAVISPNLSELNMVWDLQRLANWVEHHALSDGLTLPKDMQNKYSDGSPEDPERMEEWRTGLHKAFYRSLIVGAALAGVYQQPLHTIEESEDLKAQSKLEWVGHTETKKQFIQKFTILQTITEPQQETQVFGFLDQWLLNTILSDAKSRAAMELRFQNNTGRAATCFGEQHCVHNFEDGSHADAHLIVWEAVKVMWMMAYIPLTLSCIHEDLIGPDPVPPKAKAPVVLFPDFTPMRISGPHLDIMYPTERVGTEVRTLLKDMQVCSGQANEYLDGTDVAPLHAQFFEHSLLRYAGLRFHTSFYDHTRKSWAGDCFSELVGTLGLFAHDDVAGRRGHPDPKELSTVDFLSGSEFLEQRVAYNYAFFWHFEGKGQAIEPWFDPLQ